MPYTLNAPAKINLYLRVIGRRPDGYHDLETVFWPLPGLYDTLTLEPRAKPGITLTCSDPELPGDEKNLAWRAAKAFAESAGVPTAWRLHLEKRIPVAAGLGGGSSDAAAVLRLLNDHHGHPLTDAKLHALARGLGADVPFFLQPVPALATGIGDTLTALTVGATVLPLLLINPGVPISTAWAYRHWDTAPLPPAPPVTDAVAALAAGDLSRLAAASYNSLEHCALRKFPALQLLLEFLRAQPGCLATHISGSGATVYALCQPGVPGVLAEAVRQRFDAPFWFWTAA